MSDKKISGLPLDSDTAAEEKLWKVLGDLKHEQPSSDLRPEFYRKLADASKPTLAKQLSQWLGLSGNSGWLTAAACLVVGVGAGQFLNSPNGAESRLAVLEQNVTMLNRSLILDRLNNEQPGKRLRGVMDAARYVAGDPDIANALLVVATNDRVDTIRSAAVESLSSQVSLPSIGESLMHTLQNTESPFVQLALIDLLLRKGSDEQLNQLLTLANDGLLYPDLTRHVLTTLKRDMT